LIEDWIARFLYTIIAIGFGSHYYFLWQKRRTVKNVWSSYAATSDWRVLRDVEFAVITLAGIQDKRSLKITAYVNYFSRFRPHEYMDIILDFNNPAGIVVHSGTKEGLMGDRDIHRDKNLSRVKSGDRVFDSAYHIAGYPEDILGKVLNFSHVQSTIRMIYPNSTPLYGQPNLQIANDKFALRLPRVYYDEIQLKNFIKHSCTLADAIEDALTMIEV